MRKEYIALCARSRAANYSAQNEAAKLAEESRLLAQRLQQAEAAAV